MTLFSLFWKLKKNSCKSSKQINWANWKPSLMIMINLFKSYNFSMFCMLLYAVDIAIITKAEKALNMNIKKLWILLKNDYGRLNTDKTKTIQKIRTHNVFLPVELYNQVKSFRYHDSSKEISFDFSELFDLLDKNNQKSLLHVF